MTKPLCISPIEVFNEDGYEAFRAHLKNLEEAAFYLRNNADDLWLAEEVQAQLHTIEEFVPLLRNGPFLPNPRGDALPTNFQARKVARENGIEESVALDIVYLDKLRARIIAAAQANSSLRDFPVVHEALEKALDELENDQDNHN